MRELIYADGRHYDLMYCGAGPDVEFHVELAREIGDPILELACGTGRYLIPWAAAGCRVHGLDAAASMLSEASAKARRAGVRVELHTADMREFELQQRFQLIVLAGNSIAHLHTASDLAQCLRSVRRHLSASAAFVVDTFVPDVRLLARDGDMRYPFAEYDDPDDGARVCVTHAARYDPATQISHIRTYHRRDGSAAEQIGELWLRMWFPCELEALLIHAGFRIEQRFGSHRRQAFDGRSGKQILVCRA